MGQFSWLYADTNNEKQMLDNKMADSYLLVPPPFQKEYGKAIKEECYDGYGRMGGYDVYDLVALWNRKFIDADTFTSLALREPIKENYGGLWEHEKNNMRAEGKTEEEIKAADDFEQEENYKRGMLRYMTDKGMLKDFCNGKSDKYMKDIYGKEYLRHIGINIACYDQDNMALPFPIKITTKEMEYNSVPASLGDPDQGWELNNNEDEEVWY